MSGAAPAMLVASLKTVAQTIMSIPMLLPVGIAMIPIIPFGAAISLVIQMIQYLINYFFELTAKIIQIMVSLYSKALSKAKAQRAAAELKLYNDEKKAQDKIKSRKLFIDGRIPEIIQEMKDLAAYQAKEKTAYDTTVFDYASKAATAKAAGDVTTAQLWKDMISSLDTWLVKILLITVEIMNKKLEMWDLERELKKITPVCLIIIEKKWELLEGWADDFEVPVPYYPDLPERPNLPTLPVLPKGNCMSDKLMQMLGKWLTAPMVPPIGLTVGAVLECVRAQMAPLPPPIASKMESVTDALVSQLGFIL